MLEAIIRRVPFFAALPPRHMRWLSETLQPLDILANHVLFSEGERGDAFYIVIQGELEVSRRLAGGGVEVIGHSGPGDYVGELALIHPELTRTVTVRAVEDSELLIVTRANFDALLHRHPAMGYELARVLTERLAERNRALQAALDALRTGPSQPSDE